MLGPLEVRAGDGAPVEVAGTRLRTLLILLALTDGVAGTQRLIDGVWGANPPAGAANALQALVSRLRRTLPEATVESHPAGYRLVVGPEVVDVTRFERLVADGRRALAGDPATASVLLRDALALWRGPALLDVAGSDLAASVVPRLDELRLAAVEDRVEADLRLGRGGELVTELTALVAEFPLRERLVGALMRALCAAGRPAEALTVFERARQVLADELGTDPSPELAALHVSVLRGADTPRTNLRAELTSFVGRDDDLVRVRGLVEEYRLTTLIGPGGSGKTRLSVEAARTLLAAMPDGVWFVELARVGDAAGVPQAVLAALGVREHVHGGRLGAEPTATDPVDLLVAALGNRRVLLVLDNCEHVVGAVAEFADRLLGACPALRILATSREPLGITGEALWPVEPLALPPAGTDGTGYAAVRLLVDRARAARPGFAVDDPATVVRICRALDGMPLAIELAAARLRTMTPAQLATRLDDRFPLLTGGSRVVLPRHQTLRAVVDWSWELLSEPERVLWRRLSVFAGGATQDAAEHVCAGGPVAAVDVLDLLSALVDKSLLTVSDGDGPRYRMLETIKAYGLERLAEAGERERVRQAHAAYFVDLAEAAEPRLRRHDQLVWLARLAADHDNLTAAIRHAVAAGDPASAVRLVAVAGWYWWLSGHKAEGAVLAGEALALQGEVDDEPRAAACAMAALLVLDGLRDEKAAARWFHTAHELASRTVHAHPLLRLLGPIEQILASYQDGTTEISVGVTEPLADDPDPWVRGTARLMHGHLLLNVGREHAAAEADFEAALAEYRQLGERWGTSFALTSLADLVAWRGDLATAVEHHAQALAALSELLSSDEVVHIRVKLAALRRRAGDLPGALTALAEASAEADHLGLPTATSAVAHLRGDFARRDGDLAAARTYLVDACTMAENLSVASQFHATVLDSLGYVEVAEGDVAAAHAHYVTALGWAIESMDAPVVAQILVGIANLALHQGDATQAAVLLGAEVAIRGTADLSREDTAEVTAATRAALTPEEFTLATARGATATLARLHDLTTPTLTP
ncbi:putative ATPase [Actinophytocola oryzae]|uniref:Putative ATPase n=2 Tax=Actinophytocola oryzae TaxID=502181 RepID=A0A4R7W538_9PSEU|nr:putative ATPase [Actinophytocola oryzae]